MIGVIPRKDGKHNMDETQTRTPVEDAADETAETALTAADETACEETDDAEDEDEYEEEDELPDPEDDPYHDPMDDTIARMPRMCFYAVLFGFGIGVVLCGVVGLLFDLEIASPTPVGIVCAIIGYFIGKKLNKRRLARRAQAQQNETQN